VPFKKNISGRVGRSGYAILVLPAIGELLASDPSAAAANADRLIQIKDALGQKWRNRDD